MNAKKRRSIRIERTARIHERRTHHAYPGPVHAETPCPCSCAFCGNPRRFAKGRDRLTVQEARLAETLKLDLNAY
jgi:hypothetical protein